MTGTLAKAEPLTAALLDLVAPAIERMIDQRVAERLSAYAEPRKPDGWMTTAGASVYLSLSPEALRARVRRGTIPAHRDGDRWLYNRAELDAHIRGERPATIVALIDNASGPARLQPPGPGIRNGASDA